MKKKRIIKLKNKNHNLFNKGNKLMIIIFLIVIGVLYSLSRINKSFTPILLETAKLEINKISTIVINKAISQVLEDKINVEEIFLITKSDDGYIQTVDFNPIIVNQVLNVATTVVQDNLQMLEDGNFENINNVFEHTSSTKFRNTNQGLLMEIPVGATLKNSLLSNVGPNIPIRMHYLGDVNSNITTKVTSYGINNALVEIGVHLKMTAKIILPFITDSMNLECDIPLAIKLIQGSVPSYYGNSMLKDSSIYSIPFE